MAKRLFTANEIIAVFNLKIGFLVSRIRHKSSKDIIEIHYSFCNGDGSLNGAAQAIMKIMNIALDENSSLEAYHYDSYDEAILDYPDGLHCTICNTHLLK